MSIPLTGAGPSAPGIPWLLRDEFTDTKAAGSVNGTTATPGPGTRVVVDTNTKISVGSGVLNFATGAAANDGLWLDSVTRAAGKVMIAKLIPSNTTGIVVAGWDSNQTGAINDALRLNATAGIGIVPNGGTAITVGAYTATTYLVAAVMRGTGIYWYIKGGAFTNWTLLYITAAGTGNGYPGIQAQNTVSIFTADNLRVPDATWLPTPLAYDTFTRSNGAIGNSETSGPESQTVTARAWTGATFTVSSNKAINTPTLGSELITDGGLENWNSPTDLTSWAETLAGTSTVNQEGVVIHGGTYSTRLDVDASGSVVSINQIQSATIGKWYQFSGWMRASVAGKTGRFDTGANNFSPNLTGYERNPGTAWTQYIVTGRALTATPILYFVRGASSASSSLYGDDMSFKAFTLSELFASLTDSATSNVHIAADLVVTAGTQAGVVLNLDSAASPANFVIVYHDGTNVKIEKCVAGTYTTVASTAATYSSGARLVVNKIGSAYRVYYNNALVGSSNTISDAGIVNNTIHGLFSTYSANTMDSFALWPIVPDETVLNQVSA